MVTQPWIDALAGLMVGVLFWNLLFVICITIENQELKKKMGDLPKDELP
ncbi:MAG TPA: hypothetical protein VGT44_06380 [Ktedonobacteraceae bacterium]|nr:hypothetical protein [Ktedonobacteraceae bacterium]